MTRKNEANLEELLWPISTDSMRERFKTRAANAGYPRSLFCFHSLRSGYICSALIKCGAKEEKQKVISEKTALIAGWTPFKLAQAGYIKNVVKRAMGASRLFSHEEDGENEPIIDETLLELETFHGISFSFVSDEKSPYDSYKDIVKERARKFFGKEEVERCLMERFVNNGSKKLIEENEDLKIIAENKMESINKKKKEGQKKTYFYSIAARVARVYIKDQLYVQGKSPVEVANNFCRLEEKSTSKAPIHNRKRYTENETNETPYEKRKKEREHLMKDRKRNEKNNLRRIRWTKNDDTKLIAMFNEGKKTKEMMKAFPYRDRQHIDDHLQVLLEKGKIKRPDSIPLSEMIENIERKKDEPKKKRSYRRKKHVPDFGESDSQEEKPTKRKRSDEEKEEDDSLEEFELEIIMRKLKNTKSKRLKRSEDGSEWVRVEENEIEDEESL